ncbi:AbrB/MazE/SpoVT family DNA-binding domain-containing protein [Bosea lathyri]|uniref:Antitoxin MazE n=1 Tax=Bosea lathyri TaxID=1036778 RepID=A0A1H6BME9_9HYPH|nr:AbrB/MazE/SpoVT family DNA-binding domain-containing protein [Bosea lathyri]SEG61615.1 antitoxin MazE [Bosea lathyri]
MHSSLKKIGNSAGVVIPKPMLAEIGAKAGDSIDLTVENGRIVIQPLAKPVRAGWAEDSKRLAAEGDDGLVWPEFANDDDDQLVW